MMLSETIFRMNSEWASLRLVGFSIWQRDEMKSGSVGKVLPPKRMTMMGKVLKKRYTVYSQRVGAINSKKNTKNTKKNIPRTSGSHRCSISPCRVCRCCSHVCSSSRTGCLDPRSLLWFPGIGVEQKLCESPLSFEKWDISQTFHKIQRNFWRIWIWIPYLEMSFFPLDLPDSRSPNLATHEIPSYLWLSLWPVHSASLAVRRRRGGLGEGWEGLDLAMTHWGKSFFNESTWLFSKQKWK